MEAIRRVARARVPEVRRLCTSRVEQLERVHAVATSGYSARDYLCDRGRSADVCSALSALRRVRARALGGGGKKSVCVCVCVRLSESESCVSEYSECRLYGTVSGVHVCVAADYEYPTDPFTAAARRRKVAPGEPRIGELWQVKVTIRENLVLKACLHLPFRLCKHVHTHTHTHSIILWSVSSL